MPELESMIEQKLIEQLVYGDSQWTNRPDLKTEEDLWANFRYILEQNNKERLDGEPLTDTEFEQVKNQLQFSSFYKAGEWLVGENGKVQVHVQRDTKRLHTFLGYTGTDRCSYTGCHDPGTSPESEETIK